MKNYKITHDWCSIKNLNYDFQIDTNQEIHILEIGSFEGLSAIWFIDNFLKNEKSTITCIDPWENYSQDTDSFNSYFKEDNQWNFKDMKIKEMFLHNIIESGKSNQVKIIQGFSHEKLPLIICDKNKFDIIFIDGNHTAPFVLTDMVMSWYLLKEGGYMILDDYNWGTWDPNLSETLHPKTSVDSFINIFKDYLTETYSEYIKIIQKK